MQGGSYALKSDGSVVTLAATATKLHQLNNTDHSWTDVRADGGSCGALGLNAQWQFAQTCSLVFATQANAVLQVFDLASATAFTSLAGLTAAGGLGQGSAMVTDLAIKAAIVAGISAERPV